MSRLRVLIVDDHPIFLDGHISFITKIGPVEVDAKSYDRTESQQAIRRERPDVELEDL